MESYTFPLPQKLESEEIVEQAAAAVQHGAAAFAKSSATHRSALQLGVPDASTEPPSQSPFSPSAVFPAAHVCGAFLQHVATSVLLQVEPAQAVWSLVESYTFPLPQKLESEEIVEQAAAAVQHGAAAFAKSSATHRSALQLGVPDASTEPPSQSPSPSCSALFPAAHVCGAAQHGASAFAKSSATHESPLQLGVPDASTEPPSQLPPPSCSAIFPSAHVCEADAIDTRVEITARVFNRLIMMDGIFID